MTRRRANQVDPPVEVVIAWHLAEGDLIITGHRVVSVHREPVSRTVRIATTECNVADLPADAIVPVIRR